MAAAIACLLAVGDAAKAQETQEAEPVAPAPPTPDEDMALLAEHGFAVAREALGGSQQFDPFAVVIRDDGRVQSVSPPAEGSEQTPDVLAELLYRGLRQVVASGDYRAVAIFTDIVIAFDGKQSEAIHAGLEHRDGPCANFYHPYRRGEDGQIVLGELAVTSREGAVFEGCAALPEPEG